MDNEYKTYKPKSRLVIAARQFRRNKLAILGLAVLLLIILCCVFDNVITPYDYAEQNAQEIFADVSWEHPFGTDNYGRDLLARMLKGGQISLLLAMCAVIFSTVVGTFFGLTAAYFGKVYEAVVMRIVDIMMSIPSLLLAAAVSTALGTGVWKSVIALGIGGLAHMIRIMYASALTVKNSEYLEAARSCGASTFRLIFKHVFANCISPLVVQVTTRFGACISQVASLSFLGLGVQPPTPEWGSILSSGKQFIRQYWPIVTFPGLVIAITLICISFIGDGVRDAVDPRMKR